MKANESPEGKEKTLCKKRENETNIRDNETPLAREKRQCKKRDNEQMEELMKLHRPQKKGCLPNDSCTKRKFISKQFLN